MVSPRHVWNQSIPANVIVNFVRYIVAVEVWYLEGVSCYSRLLKVSKVVEKNQLDATITIYWFPISAQHVSGNLFPIFRSVRLRFTARGIASCCGRLGFGERQRGTT